MFTKRQQMIEKKNENKTKKGTPTGVCLVVAGGLTQDLTLILSTKNTEQNKTKKRKPKQESIYYKRSGEGFIVKNICCALLPATTSLKMPIAKKTCCVLLPLSFMKNFKMKICCVLLPVTLWRRYSCVLLSSSAVFFINVFIKNYASGAESRAGRVCMSGTYYQ